MRDDVSGIILAGGKSRRMGRDKAFIEMEGKPLIAHVIERVRPLCGEIILVANDAEAFAPFGERVVGDIYPGKGSLGGLFTGLAVARAQYVLAVACDMPFLHADLLRHMISLAPQFDIVIPRARDASSKTAHRLPGQSRAGKPLAKQIDLHPMHAIYSKRCLPTIESQIRAGDFRLIGFYDHLRVRIVETDEVDRFDATHLSFFNVNTPEDLTSALTLARDSSHV